MAIDFLPHRKFAPASFTQKTDFDLVSMDDWVLGFHEIGGAPIRFKLEDLIESLELSQDIDPDEVFWWVPLSTIKKLPGSRVKMAITSLSVDPNESLPNVSAIGGILTATDSTFDIVRMNQNKDAANVPAYILQFKAGHSSESNPSKGATAISYEPFYPGRSSLYNEGGDARVGSSSNLDIGPTVMMTYYPTGVSNIVPEGIMVRTPFIYSGIPFIDNIESWIKPTVQDAFNTATVKDLSVQPGITFTVAQQVVGDGGSTSADKKFQPWLTNRIARHDTPYIVGNQRGDWPDKQGRSGFGFYIGDWWSSAGSTATSTWEVLSSDISGQDQDNDNNIPKPIEDPDFKPMYSDYSFNEFRDCFDFLITAHWGLKNLKPCVIVWEQDMGFQETDFPQTRPKNWLYRGEPLQPGDMYFYIF